MKIYESKTSGKFLETQCSKACKDILFEVKDMMLHLAQTTSKKECLP